MSLAGSFKRYWWKPNHRSNTDPSWPKARPICLGLPWPPQSTPTRCRQPPSNTVTGAQKPHRKQTPHGSVLWNVRCLAKSDNKQQQLCGTEKRVDFSLSNGAIIKTETISINDLQLVFLPVRDFQEMRGLLVPILIMAPRGNETMNHKQRGTIPKVWRMKPFLSSFLSSSWT